MTNIDLFNIAKETIPAEQFADLMIISKEQAAEQAYEYIARAQRTEISAVINEIAEYYGVSADINKDTADYRESVDACIIDISTIDWEAVKDYASSIVKAAKELEPRIAEQDGF